MPKVKGPAPLPPRIKFLLQQQKRWTSKHIEFLKTTRRCDVTASEIVGSEYILGDDDAMFQELCTQIRGNQGDKVDKGMWRNGCNIFDGFFHNLETIEESVQIGRHKLPTNRFTLSFLLSPIVSHIGIKNKFCVSYQRSMKFSLAKYYANCILRFSGLICNYTGKRGEEPFVLMTYTAEGNPPFQGFEKCELPQLIALAMFAYGRFPKRKNYRAFSLRMMGAVLQVSAADIPLTFVKELLRQKPVSEGIEILSSQRFDLQQPCGRREALILLIGLLKHLDHWVSENWESQVIGVKSAEIIPRAEGRNRA